MFSLTPWKSLPRPMQIILTLQGFFFIMITLFPKAPLLEFGALYGPDFWNRPWSLLSYQFLHGGVFHFLFNMLLFWMAGPEIYQALGVKRFWGFSLGSGALAGIIAIPIYYWMGTYTVVIGFSGSLMAFLLWYGNMFPNRQILLFFVFPLKMKYAVYVFAGIDLLSSASNTETGIAHLVHLGGFAAGLLFWWVWNDKRARLGYNPWGSSRLSSYKSLHQSEPLVKKGNENADTFFEENLELDKILQKISKSGFESLSQNEKAKLDEISKHKQVQKGKIIPFKLKE